MANYSLFIERAVYKNLRHIPEHDFQSIMNAIQKLPFNPRPMDSKKLKGRSGYRIRVGNYRIIYEINDRALRVTVIEAGDRKGIYG